MITITIGTDSAAFEGDALGREVGRILRELAGKAEEWGPMSDELDAADWDSSALLPVMDINGNRVGDFVVEL